jgi:molybdenum cofactor guanylyltransferase
LEPEAALAPVDAAGFVLAGGQSSRMGSDKALTPLGGKPLIVHALAVLRDASLWAAISGARSDLKAYAPVLEDAGGGPLSGLLSALESTSAERAVFLSVDMPLLPPSLIRALVERALLTEAAVVHASVSGFAETFPVVVDRRLLPGLEAVRRGGISGCFSALRTAAAELGKHSAVLPVEGLVQSGYLEDLRGMAPTFWFLNVNTPRDLARAEALLEMHRVS